MKQIFTLMAITLFTNAYSQHNAGTLDSSFGNNGISITGFTGIPRCNDIALMQDGGFIAAGSLSSTSRDSGMCVFKYTNDGLLDSSFGENGVTIIHFNYDVREAKAVAVQPDGKIVVTGYIGKGLFPTNYDIPVARINTNGSLDSSFGTNGIIIADYNNDDFGNGITIQSDGKILIEGKTIGSFMTSRYLTSGTLDESFGDAGKVITAISGLSAGTAAAVQNDGKIIAVGTSDQKIVLIRYMPDGSLDNSFGIDGIVRSDLTKNNDVANDVALQPDGKILIAGYTVSLSTDSALVARYNEDGGLDNSFGKNGFTTNKARFGSAAFKLALESDGKIIIGGNIGGNFFDTSAFLASRLNTDGNIDSSFGINGNVITNMLGGSAAYGMVIQDNGKIILAGNTGDAMGKSYVALTRYNNDVSKKQILIAKILRWLQHHNGIVWDDIPGVKSYAVQRSMDGARWITVYRSPLTAHRSQLANSYVDPAPLAGTNYYRLQITDTDGAVVHSDVITINNESSTISLSPNPARNVLHIEGLPSSAKTKITVVDLAGNIACSVQLEPVPTQSGANSSSYNLNVEKLKPGNYLLRIETADGVITKQFVKQ